MPGGAPVLVVTYLDPVLVFAEGDDGELPEFEVVGVLVDAPWPGWIGIASEWGMGTHRAITYLPRGCVVTSVELTWPTSE